jgi:hypothetical protein
MVFQKTSEKWKSARNSRRGPEEEEDEEEEEVTQPWFFQVATSFWVLALPFDSV